MGAEATIGAMSRLRIGALAPNFSLSGVDGVTHSLSDYIGKPVAVVFSCCHCPYVIAWESRLNQIAVDYADRAGVLVINSNDHIGDRLENMQERVQAADLTFPFLRDETQDTARGYGASRTPEAFALDREHRLLYHGAPDSNYQDPGGAVPHLRHALDAAIEGRTPSLPETPSVGCTIKWRAG